MYLLSCLVLYAQSNVKIIVTDEQSNPIVKASLLFENKKYYTDKNGQLIISAPKGIYKIRISAVGYNTISDTISVSKIQNEFVYILKEDILKLNNVLVTGSYSPHTLSSTPINSSIIT
ncbi:MAG: carboxypeptidase-like regulatory domain-containing protein, partial [Fervidobacterium sp.]